MEGNKWIKGGETGGCCKEQAPSYLILEYNMDVEEGSRGADGWALAVGPRRDAPYLFRLAFMRRPASAWGNCIRDLQGSFKPNSPRGGLVSGKSR